MKGIQNEKEEYEEGETTSYGKGERVKKRLIKKEATMFKTQTKQERSMEVSNNYKVNRSSVHCNNT